MLTLVTGATGMVGNNVARLLTARGDKVRVLVRQQTNVPSLAGLPLEIAHGDIRDQASVQAAMAGVTHVVHAAAEVRIGWTGMQSQREINVRGTQLVAGAARAAGARMVYVSSVNALGLGSRATPGNEDSPPVGSVPCPYVITKREAERVLLAEVAAGLDAVIVNPAFMLGPWDWKPSSGKLLLEIASGWALMAPPGGNDVCDVRDVAAGVLAALDRGATGRRYILGGEPLSFVEIFRMLAEITGVRPPVRKARWPALWVIGNWGDLRTEITGREPATNSAAVAMSALEHHYSYARAAAELGYRPRPAREAAEAAWDWFKTHGYVKAARQRKIGS